MKFKLIAALAVVTCATALPKFAEAAVTIGNTAGGPTWNRPLGGSPPTPPLSSVGTAVPYTVIPFAVDTDGSYVFQSTAVTPANWDNYAFLYVNSFDPLSPFTNILAGNDDNPSIGLSGFTSSLTAGLSYFFVGTGFGNGDAGEFSLSVTGPGAVNFRGSNAAVPEPATWAMMLLGFGLIGGAMRGKVRYQQQKVRFAF